MVKKSNKILLIISLIIMIIGIATSTQAKLVQTFDIIKSKEEINLDNELGKVSKEILKIDKEENQIDMQIKIENKFDKDTEIIFVIDNSGSMDNKVDGNLSRKQKVVQTTEKLISEIYKDLDKVKIGVVEFSTNPSTLFEITDKEEDLIDKLKTFENEAIGGSTKVVSGIELAKTMYTENAKQKIMIILTDGEPTDAPSDVNKALKDAEEDGIIIFTEIIDISQSAKLVESFGTVEEPVAGRLYDITTVSISEIAEEIEEIMKKELSGTIYDIKVEDFFPQEIIDSFNIQVGKPTKGIITNDITTNRRIQWDIDKLERGENAVLEFKLFSKIKDSISKELKTNEDFVITYKDGLDKEYKKQLTNQPQIKITTTEVQENDNENNTIGNIIDNNNTIKDTQQNNIQYITGDVVNKLPQTGDSYIILIVAAITVILAIILGVKYKKYNDM